MVSRTERRSPEKGVSFEYQTYEANPYLDYGRGLTDEGGILFVYKDIDVRLRHTVWRVVAWSLFTGIEALWQQHHYPAPDFWTEVVCLAAVATLNFLIVRKPVELYRRIEVRPDCLIVEGTDVFWSRFIDGDLPAFRLDDADTAVFCGIYGTRFVEYLTVRRFDDDDRLMEVFAAHLKEAMEQQWSRPPQKPAGGK